MLDKRLAILDDDWAVAQVLRSAAEREAFEVRIAHDHEGFRALIADWRPTHVAIDLVMRGADGVAIAAELHGAGQPPCVILMSGAGKAVLNAAARDARERGVAIHGLLPKPFKISSFLRLLRFTGSALPRETLPSHTSACLDEGPVAVSDGQGDVIEVLVVSASALLREGVRSLLAQSEGGSIAGVVTDAAEALDLLASREGVDVAVIDASTGALRVADTCQRLRAAYPALGIVIVYLHAEDLSVLKASVPGFVVYLCETDITSASLMAAFSSAKGLPEIRGEPGIGTQGAISLWEALSDREKQVLRLTVDGQSRLAIAAAAGISAKTVDTYRQRIKAKLGISDVAGLVKFAVQLGITRAQ